MKERIVGYRKRIDALLSSESPDTDWEGIKEEHLTQIGFFMHERLVHLLVTLCFAILVFICVAIYVIADYPMMLLLIFGLMILLVPYIAHYYTLENEVQKMYVQYDKILQNIKAQKIS